MKYFNFERLISKYSVEFDVYVPVSVGDYADNGEYIKSDNIKITVKGAILSLSEAKIYRSEGNLTANDRILFMTSDFDFELEGAFVVYNNKKYYIESMFENAEFTGVFQYNLKYVSAFKVGDVNG